MYEYIQGLYGVVFTAADLPGFVTAGWLTQEQADTLTAGKGE